MNDPELGVLYKVRLADHFSGNMKHMNTLCVRGVVGVYISSFELNGLKVLAFANWWTEDDAKFDETTTEVAYVLEAAILELKRLDA